mmetsp:Transcript_20702/g.38815  ORF Transcript_20702/g.38815 Transcript_20702/m.38815 type:complete len:233 (+) Transcript_20702:24-722(+)
MNGTHVSTPTLPTQRTSANPHPQTQARHEQHLPHPAPQPLGSAPDDAGCASGWSAVEQRPQRRAARPRRALARLQPQALGPVWWPRGRQWQRFWRWFARHEGRWHWHRADRRGRRTRMAGQRLLHRAGRPAGRHHLLRQVQQDRRGRLSVAPALSAAAARDRVGDPVAAGRRRAQCGRGRDRPARFVDADAGRKHRRHPLHGAVHDQGCARLPVRERTAQGRRGAGCRIRGA